MCAEGNPFPFRGGEDVKEELKPIFKKHDIAGFVALHEPGAVEFSHMLRPSYSCVILDQDTGAARIRARRQDHGGDVEKVQQLKSDTANMLHMLSYIVAREAANLIHLSEYMDKITGAEHG